MKISKSDRTNADSNLANGLVKMVGKGRIVIDGKAYSGTELAKLLRARVDVAAEVATARAAWQEAVEKERGLVATTKKLAAAARAMVKLMFASSPDALVHFGLEPPKPRRTPSLEARNLAVEKARATRAARHTMGPRKRAAIRGVLPTPIESDVRLNDPPETEPTMEESHNVGA